VDYSLLELCTLAATCLKRYGFSKLAEAINSGKDVHIITGAGVSGEPYEAVVQGRKSSDEATRKKYDNIRQSSKAINFGKPGGLGNRTLAIYAKSNYGVEMSAAEAKAFSDVWLRLWPEAAQYLKDNGNIIGGFGKRGTAETIHGRKKADCLFSEYCNFSFQGLAADGAKAAGWSLYREMMLASYYQMYPQAQGFGDHVRGSPLAGSHIVNFIHDQYLCEHRAEVAPQALKRQQAIMEENMAKYVPGVTIRTEGKLLDRWKK
jgi:DNA polymerase I-like protein with 3'-5' exonuclease and polymerase domains